MKFLPRSPLAVAVVLLTVSATCAQLPRSLHPNITVGKLMNTQAQGVRLAYDATTQRLFYHSFAGDIYRIEQPTNGQPYEVTIAAAADHGINYLQGMAFTNGKLVLAGNIKQSGQQGYGLVVKGTPLPNGTWHWEKIAQTESYPSSDVLYDHAFNAVCISPAQDSVYVNSGSRTDHGEIEDTGGRYPNTREVALTATIFKLPLNPPAPVYLPNDEAALAQSGYVFCRGVRNEFDLALNKQGRLFGVENSGDRDDPEEMNWLRPGRHYGFPWEMGGNVTPQQFPGYDPGQDKLLPATLPPDQQLKFHNDPTYPVRPAGLVITQPIRNLGPDASFSRDPATGQVQQTVPLSTFTAHRSPLGLIFDLDNALADFTGDAFVLSYSTSGGAPGSFLGAEDAGEDMLHVKLRYDPATDNYTAKTTKIVDQFMGPTDAERVGNVVYVIERDRQAIWTLTFRPLDPLALADLSVRMSASTLVTDPDHPVSVTLTVQNDGPAEARQIQVENRLPPFVTYAGGSLTNTNGVLTGALPALGSGQQIQFVYQLAASQAGTFRNAAQVLASATADSDSEPGSGTEDGQDDAALLTFRTASFATDVFTSPNPDQQPLPLLRANQPLPVADKADLSLHLVASSLTPAVNDLVSFTAVVANEGGQAASAITVDYTLPAQMAFVSGAGWASSGQQLTGQLAAVAAGSSSTLTFQARITGSGRLVSRAQISAATPADPDSTPGNGLNTGEDDTAQIELRTR